MFTWIMTGFICETQKERTSLSYYVVNSKVLWLGSQISKYFKRWFLSTRRQVPQGSLGHKCVQQEERGVRVFQTLLSLFSRCHVQLSVIPWSVARWVPLSFTASWSLLKFTSTEPAALSKHSSSAIPPLLPSVFPSIRDFSSESALRIGCPTIGASASAVVRSMNIQGWFPLGPVCASDRGNVIQGDS